MDRAQAISNNFQTANAELEDSPRKRMYQLAMAYLFQVAKSVERVEDRNRRAASGRGVRPGVGFLRFNYNILDRLKDHVIIDLQREEMEGGREFVALEQEMAPEVQRLLREASEGTDMGSSEPSG
jgi:hypothetical protein